MAHPKFTHGLPQLLDRQEEMSLSGFLENPAAFSRPGAIGALFKAFDNDLSGAHSGSLPDG
jgi:hypothetical protein